MLVASERSLVFDAPFKPTILMTNYFIGAVVSDEQGISHFECWTFELQASGAIPSADAYAFLLGGLDGTNYNVHPVGGDAGAQFHLAPSPQYIIYLSGAAEYALPNSTQTFLATAGDIVIIVDSASMGAKYGHTTNYSVGATNLGSPFTNGVIPPHNVISTTGPCTLYNPPYTLPANATTG
ncbi:MAG: hypothetical protein CYPHOPRED_004282 [Cyphobasidiales sp. Tagirdzhanova-0007]|nr:MAG: hypothetical protein CYPHOPRED_004282 [Cyphobasidiales sp. Tagirdzhanova-0007]